MKKVIRPAAFLLAAVLMLTSAVQGFADISSDPSTDIYSVSVESGEEDEGTGTADVDAGDSITDPVLETYIEENADTSYTGSGRKKLVNFIAVKQTFFDASLIEDGDTSDSIMAGIEAGDEEALEKYLMQSTSYAPVYELDENSDYYAVFLDTMQGTSSVQTMGASFAVNNTDGETVDGCFYDTETGIGYIPKDLLLNEDGEQVLLYLQAQVAQVMDTDTYTTSITVTVEDGKDVLSITEADANVYDTETSIVIEAGLDIQSVTANGVPVTEEGFSYDPDTGEMYVGLPAASVQNISITVPEEESQGVSGTLKSAAGRAVSAIRGIFTTEAEAATAVGSYDAMNYFATGIDIGSCTQGTYYDVDVNYSYDASYKYSTSTVLYAALGESDTYYAELVNAIDNGGSVDLSHVQELNGMVWTPMQVELDTSSVKAANAGLGSITATLTLECGHVDVALGTASDNNATVVKARIRCLYKGSDYAVFGIVTQKTHQQSGLALFKVGITTNGKASVHKVTDGADTVDTDIIGFTGNSNYSLAGAVFGVYTDTGCLNRVGTLTTDSNGDTEELSLAAGEYYIKEISASPGYDIDTKVRPCTVSNGTTTTVTFYEPPKYGYIVVQKNLDTSSAPAGYTASELSELSLEGAKYQVFSTYAEAEAALTGGASNPARLATLTTDSSGYAASTAKFAIGTYYIKEVVAPEGLAYDSTVYTVTVAAGATGGATYTVTSTEHPEYGYIKITKALEDSNASSNSNYSVANAEFGIYSSESDAENDTNRVQTLVTDSSGEAVSGMLKPGTYYVKETAAGASMGCWVNEEKYEVVVEGSHTSDVTYDVDETIYEPVQTGRIRIYKESADESATDGNSNYDLTGAEYTVYLEDGETEAIDIYGSSVVITVDQEEDGEYYGTSNLLYLGTYIIKETKAPQGYELDSEEYKVTVRETVMFTEQDVALYNKNPQTYSVKSTDEPWKVCLAVQKTIDYNSLSFEETRGYDMSTLIQYFESSSDYSLEGAEYCIYGSYEGALNEDGSEFVAKVTTDADGYGQTDITVPMGTYYIKETQAPDGFELDTSGGPYGNGIYVLDANYNDPVTYDQQIITLTHEERPETGEIEVYKKSKEQSLVDTYPEYYSLEGAEYTVYYDDGCNIVAGTITTDEDGYGILDGLMLGITYYVKETKAPTAALEIDGVTVDTAMYELDETLYEVTIGSSRASEPVVSYEEPVYRDLYVYKGPLQMLETGYEFTLHIPAAATKVVFTTDKEIPETYTSSNYRTDVSYAKNEGIIGWLEGDTWYVQAADGGTIYFNYDSSYMFEEEGWYTTDDNSYGHRIESVDFGNGVIDTSYTTDMTRMFFHDISLTSITGLSEFNTSSVTAMTGMFMAACTLTEIDLSGWDTSSVTDMGDMFAHCRDLVDITVDSGFDTSNVTNYHDLLAYTNMANSKYQYMVDNIEFNTSIVTNMSEIFLEGESGQSGYECKYTLTSIDLSSWNLGSVTSSINMAGLFDWCENLTTVSGLSIPASATSVAYMFQHCLVLGSGLSPMTVNFYVTDSTLAYTDMFADCSTSLSEDEREGIVADGYYDESVVLSCTTSAQAAVAKLCVGTAGEDEKNSIIVVKLNGIVQTASLDATGNSVMTASIGSRLAGLTSAVMDAFTAAAVAFAEDAGGTPDTYAIATGTNVMSLAESLAEKAGLVTVAQAETDESSYPNLCDAVYSAYTSPDFSDESKWADFEFERLDTDENTGVQTAVYVLHNVPYGLALYVKETSPASGYGLDENTWEFGEEDRSGSYVNSYDPTTENPNEVWISMQKKLDTDADVDLSEGSPYSMAGIQYIVYTDAACTTQLYWDEDGDGTAETPAVLTLTETGVSNTIGPVDIGDADSVTYYIKEDPTQFAKVQAGGSGTALILDETEYSLTAVKNEKTTLYFEVEDDVVIDGSIIIKKTSSSSSITASTSSEYSYEGAGFKIYTDPELTQLYAVIYTDATYTATCTGMPIGTYYIQEFKAPSGFELNTTIYRAEITVVDGVAVTTYYEGINGTVALSTATLTAKDEPEYGEVEIYKTVDASGTLDPDLYGPEGAEFTIYSDSACTQAVATLTTDEYGYASYTGLTLGKTYYIKETGASKGCVLNTDKFTVSTTASSLIYRLDVPNDTDTVPLTISKSADGTVSSAYTFEGITYGVYADEDCTELVGKIELDADGTGTLDGLDASATYYVKEIETNDYYELSDEVYTVDMTESGSAGYTLPVSDTPKYGKLRIYKVSANASITSGNSMYSLKDAVFGVYTKESITSGSKVGELTIGEDQFSDYLEGLEFGTYYVKEITAPEGYVADTTVYAVEVLPDSAGEAAVTYRISNTPGYSNLKLIITKKAADGVDVGSLEGTQFTIYYYDGQYSSVDELDGVSYTRRWVIEAQDDGNANYVAVLDEDHCLEGMAGLYYDSDGNVVIPLGTIVIEETSAADGYSTNGSWYDFGGNVLAGTEEAMLINITQESDGGTVSLSADNALVKDDSAYCGLTIIKQDTSGKTLGNVTYDLYRYNESTGEYEYQSSRTTSGDGVASWEGLTYGTYQVREASTQEGYTLLDSPITVVLPYTISVSDAEAAGVDTTDAYLSEDGKTYNYINLTYTVTDGTTFKVPKAGGAAWPVPGGIGLALAAAGLFLTFNRRKTVKP
ncbi:MAG: BspA family leucine-rich repeat surface protein [Clostridiales bacterium]|nr:BspA family leucine-rich repeat surface protein [Clostridiales bacterium]